MKKTSILKFIFFLLIMIVINVTWQNISNATTIKSSQLINEMYLRKESITAGTMAIANSDSGVTIQQGNITVYVDTNLKISTDIAKYRTYYGVGETVKVQVQFDKIIASTEDLQLVLLFGNGTERVIKTATNKNGVLTFTYSIVAGDEGQLELRHLSGKVTDEDGNTINIGLSQADSIRFPNTIIAKTNAITVIHQVNSNVPTEQQKYIYGIDVVSTFSDGPIYAKKDNIIKNIDESELFEYINITIGGYKAKNQPSNFKMKGANQFEFEYDAAKGEYGNLVIKSLNGYICDRAGNYISIGTISNSTITITGTHDGYEYTPTVTGVNVSSNLGHKKAGDEITFNVKFNDNVYGGLNKEVINLEELTNKKLVSVQFGDKNAIGTATAYNNDTANKMISYRYTIQDGDNGALSISVNYAKVYDSVGHPNQAYTKQTFSDTIADTIKPSILSTSEEVNNTNVSGRYLGVGATLTRKVTFSDIYIIINNTLTSPIKMQIGDKVIVKPKYQSESNSVLSIPYTIQANENGGIHYTVGQVVMDQAGNLNDLAEYTSSYLADTTPPSEITVTSDAINNETNKNVLTYTFDIKDPELTVYDGTVVAGSGIKANQFDLDDIIVSNGTILDSTKDNSGNLKTIRVLAERDGVQTLYIKGKEIYDNVNNKATLTEQTYIVKINREAPQITFNNNGGNYILPTQGNAKIETEVSASKQLSKLEYAWTNSTETPSAYSTIENLNGVYKVGKSDITSIGNWYLHVKATDTAGNVGTAISNAFNISNSSITLTPSITDITNQDVNVEIQYGNCLTENRYAGLGNDRNANLDNVIVKENGNVCAEATDKMGNKVTASLEVNNIDKIPPKLGKLLMKIGSENGKEYISGTCTNQNVYIRLQENGTDNESGHKSTYYKIKNIGDESESEKKFDATTLTDNGSYIIIFVTEDNAGNIVSKEYEINIYRYAPIISSYNFNSLTSNSIGLTISACSVGRTSLDKIVWYHKLRNDSTYISEEEAYNSNNESKTKYFMGLKAGQYYDIYVEIYDTAGNVSTSEVYTRATESIPILFENSTSFTITPNEWTNQNVTVTVSANTRGYKLQTRKDNGDWEDTNTQIFTENGTIDAVLTDGTNIGGSISKKITNIDKTNPIAGTLKMKLGSKDGADYTNNTLTNQNVYIELVDGTDNESGHKSTSYTIDGGESKTDAQTLTETGTYTIVVTTEDNAGNTSSNTYTIKIEKTSTPGDLNITSDKYEIEDGDIAGVDLETTVKDIKENITSDEELTIVDKDGNELKDTDIVGTGSKVQAGDEEYTIIVKGDVNGDGNVTITDLVKYKRHIIDIKKLEDIYFKAADLNNDGDITIGDLAKIKRMIIGLN